MMQEAPGEQYFSVLPSTYSELVLDFEWYSRVRFELVRSFLEHHPRLVDVGTGHGETLLQVASRVSSGLGIDIDADAVHDAAARARLQGIENVRFLLADAQATGLHSDDFDVATILGDVLSYPNLFGRTAKVLTEARRILRPGGTIIIDGMDWAREYAQNPSWSFFLRERDDCFVFCEATRSEDGLETVHRRAVLNPSPLHDWLAKLDWPAPRGHDQASIDVRLHVQLPDAWLGPAVSQPGRYYTVRTVVQELETAGFDNPKAVCYGMTYDVASRAGLTSLLREHIPGLAAAEAGLALETGTGAGPWLFAWAGKPT